MKHYNNAIKLLTGSLCSFILSLILGFSWLDTEMELNKKRNLIGLKDAENIQWIVFRYTPAILFYGAVILLIIGIILLVKSKNT